MGVFYPKIFPIEKILNTHAGGEHSARLSTPGLQNGWTRYEQLEGSWCASIKRAEIEVLSCVRGYHVYKDRQAAADGDL